MLGFRTLKADIGLGADTRRCAVKVVCTPLIRLDFVRPVPSLCLCLSTLRTHGSVGIVCRPERNSISISKDEDFPERRSPYESLPPSLDNRLCLMTRPCRSSAFLNRPCCAAAAFTVWKAGNDDVCALLTLSITIVMDRTKFGWYTCASRYAVYRTLTNG